MTSLAKVVSIKRLRMLERVKSRITGKLAQN